MGNSIMTALVINGDTSGSITLQAPATAGSSVHTLPAATGTVMVSGNMPTFYAYASGTPSFSASTVTKVQFNSELFDTASCFDSSTNYRFTPNVAGYYLINSSVAFVSAGQSQASTMVHKNGTMYARWESRATQSYYLAGGSTIVYLNGSTDYIESYLYCNGNGYIDNGQQYTCMSGMLMRAGAA
jgi:hypothetical protein